MSFITPPTFAGHGTVASADLNTLSGDLNYLNRRGAVRLQRSADLSVANDTITPVDFDMESFDTPDNDLHSLSSNTTRITIPTGKAGIWVVGASVQFAANATGYRQLTLRLNGVTNLAQQTVNAVTASAIQTSMTVVVLSQFSAADYVECVVRQTSGAALALSHIVDSSPVFWAVCVHG